MKKVKSKNIIEDYNLLAITSIISVLFLFSCTNLSIEPDQSNQPNSKINILTPAANGNLQEGENQIVYSLVQPSSINL